MNWEQSLREFWVALRSRWIDPVRAWWVLREERRLLREGPAPDVERPSVIFYSMHRSGSTFMHRVLRSLASEEGFRGVNLERYFTLTRGPGEPAPAGRTSRPELFCEEGYYYGVFRRWWPPLDLAPYRILLLLRDPRDVLTSHYFSLTVGHRMMSREHYRQRIEARRMGLQRFVRSAAPTWKRKYERYFEHLLPRSNVQLVRYEDMVEDLPSTMETVTGHLGWKDRPGRWDSMLQRGVFDVPDENPAGHKRTVSPGDHRDKLTEETLRRLNETFRSCLERLGYPVG